MQYTTKMLAELRAEREQVEEAILVRERIASGPGKRRGRPPKNPGIVPAVPAPAPALAKKRKGWTAAQRKAAAERAKAVWAKRRKKSGKKG